MYANVNTLEKKSRLEVMRQFNASISEGASYSDWMPLVYDAQPAVGENQYVTEGPVVLKDGKPTQTWVVQDIPAQPV